MCSRDKEVAFYRPCHPQLSACLLTVGDSTPSCTSTESAQCLRNVTATPHSSATADMLDRPLNNVFSAKQEEHFERRLEEGYDLPDPVYEEWLKLRHPQSSWATSPPMPLGQKLSLSDHFTGVSLLTPVAANISTTSISLSATSSKPAGNTPTLVSSGSSGKDKDDSLSKQLVVPSAATPVGPKRAPPHASLLTSTAALEILEEKEQKKKRELKLKQQRKR